MTDLEIVRQMQRELLRRGHTIKTREDSDGSVCLVGAYEYARWGDLDACHDHNVSAYEAATALFAPELGKTEGYADLAEYNDYELLTLSNACAFLQQAERRILAGSPEPSPDVPDDIRVECSPESSRELVPA